MMINKNQFSIANDKKVLHKIGKKWVTVSALTLALLGASTVAMKVSHASAVQSSQNNNQNQVKSNVIASAGDAVQSGNVRVASQGIRPAVQQSAVQSARPVMQSSARLNQVRSASVIPKSNVQRPVQSLSQTPKVSSASAQGRVDSIQKNAKALHNNIMHNMPKVSNPAPKVQKPYAPSAPVKPVQQSKSANKLNLNQPKATDVKLNQPKVNNSLKLDLNNKVNKQNNKVDIDDDKVKIRAIAKQPHNKGIKKLLGGTSYVTEIVHFHDIYSDIDGLGKDVPSDSVVSGNINTKENIGMPKQWAFVNNNGKLIDSDGTSDNFGGTSDNFTLKNGTQTFNVVPRYAGMSFKYNKNTNSVEFTGGVANSDLTAIGGLLNDSYISNASSIKIDSDVDFSRLTNMDNMFENGYNISSIVIPSSKIKLYGNLGLPNMYKQLPEEDTNGNNYTLATPNDFAQGNVGTFVSNANPKGNAESCDIFSDIDGMNSNQLINSGSSNWAYVNAQGKNVITPMTNAQDKIMIAPVYKGLVYKYDKNNHILEFTDGKINVSDISNFLNVPQFGGGYDSSINDYDNNTLTSVKFDSDIDTSKVTNMSYMFNSDTHLKSLDLGSNFDTSNVTNMADMFGGDTALQSLDLGNHFDTSNVTDMSGMFDNVGLQSLDFVNKFNTYKVTDMSGMFKRENNLQSLNLGNNFNTSNVTNMSWMFAGDADLQSLTLDKNFDTSKVINMYNMFGKGVAKIGRHWIVVRDTSLDKIIIKSSNTAFDRKSSINDTGILLPKTLKDLPYKNRQKLINDILSAQKDASDSDNSDTYGQLISDSDCSSDFTSSDINELKPYSSLKPVEINQWYKRDANDNYTSPTPNDFTKVNVGIFVRPKNVPVNGIYKTDTIKYQYNGSTLAIQHFGGYTNLNINKYNATLIPSDYQLVNKNNNIPFDNGIHNVAIVPSTVANTEIIHFHDIYSNIDGITAPPSITITTSKPNSNCIIAAPQNWALVNNNGNLIGNNGESDKLIFQNGTKTLNVAPVYYGLTYKYDKNKGSFEFTHGTLTWNSNFYNSNDIPFIGISNNSDITPIAKLSISDVKSIKFDNDVDTSNVISMSDMFSGDTALQSLNLGNNFDTSKVTDMGQMFMSDKSLTSLNLGNKFNTSNVTSMFSMFSSDSALQSLNLGNNFDAENVTNMSDMFSSDSNLQSLDLGNHFDTSKVFNMSGMFARDFALQSLDLGNYFDTSKVWSMSAMFLADETLQSLNLGNHFDTSKVTNMSNMFAYNSALMSLNLGNNFDTSKVTDMGQMFMSDKSLTSLNLGNKFNTSKVSDMNSMFDDDSALQSLNLGNNFDTSKVTDMSQMFNYDNNLNQITIQSPNTKISDRSGKSHIPTMYKPLSQKDSNGNNYTALTPNDFSDGNVGTFVRPENIPVDTVNYQYNGKTIASQQFKGDAQHYNGNGYNNLDVNKSDATSIPSGYHLVNTDNNIPFDNGTHDVAIVPNISSVSATVAPLNSDLAKASASNAQASQSAENANSYANHDLLNIVSANDSTDYNSVSSEMQLASNDQTLAQNYINDAKSASNAGNGSAVTTDLASVSAENNQINTELSSANADLDKMQEVERQNYVQASPVIVRYVDIHHGDQVSTAYGNDKFGNPIIGTQNLGVIGHVGSIKLGIKGNHDASNVKDLLQIPVGYHLVNNSTNKYAKVNDSIVRVILKRLTDKSGNVRPMILTMVFSGFRHTAPKKPARPVRVNHAKSSSVAPKSNMASSASVASSSSASVSSAPSASSSANSQSVASSAPSASSHDNSIHSLNAQIKSLEATVTPNRLKSTKTVARNSKQVAVPKMNRNRGNNHAFKYENRPAVHSNSTKPVVQTVKSSAEPNIQSSSSVNVPESDKPSRSVQQQSSELPQTSEKQNSVAGIMSVLLLLSSLSLAGVDLDRKRN